MLVFRPILLCLDPLVLTLFFQAATMRAMARGKDDPVIERFIDYFYAKCCENLFRPMAELPEHQKITGAMFLFESA